MARGPRPVLAERLTGTRGADRRCRQGLARHSARHRFRRCVRLPWVLAV